MCRWLREGRERTSTRTSLSCGIDRFGDLGTASTSTSLLHPFTRSSVSCSLLQQGARLRGSCVSYPAHLPARSSAHLEPPASGKLEDSARGSSLVQNDRSPTQGRSWKVMGGGYPRQIDSEERRLEFQCCSSYRRCSQHWCRCCRS